MIDENEGEGSSEFIYRRVRERVKGDSWHREREREFSSNRRGHVKARKLLVAGAGKICWTRCTYLLEMTCSNLDSSLCIYSVAFLVVIVPLLTNNLIKNLFY